jgi:hypothetical protein
MSWTEYVEKLRQYERERAQEMAAYRQALQVTPPWETRCVLVGPFDPRVEHTQWYGAGRNVRHRRRAEVNTNPTPDHVHTLINSVPVPLRHMRHLLQTLRLAATQSTASPQGQLTWQQAFTANAEGWHTVDLLANSAHSIATTLQTLATQRIQALRTRAYSNGGWWPAPSSIRLAYHPGPARMQATMTFAAHYMDKDRTILMLPLSAQPLAAH